MTAVKPSHIVSRVEARWPRLRIERSELEPWPGTLYCVLGKHFTITVTLSTHVYKRVTANLMLGGILWWTQYPTQGGVEMFQVASCYRNRDKLRPADEPLDSYADLTILRIMANGTNEAHHCSQIYLFCTNSGPFEFDSHQEP